MAEAAAALRLIGGTVDKDGKILKGAGFYVARVDSGRYHITFAKPFDNVYGACATVYRAPSVLSTLDNAQVYRVENDSIFVATGRNNGDFSDQEFCFFVFGIG